MGKIQRLSALGACLLAGCGTVPYMETGIGYQVNGLSDPWYDELEQTGNAGQPWRFTLEAGFEGVSGRCGWVHESGAFDGNPFNSDAELFREMIICKKKWGGK